MSTWSPSGWFSRGWRRGWGVGGGELSVARGRGGGVELSVALVEGPARFSLLSWALGRKQRWWGGWSGDLCVWPRGCGCCQESLCPWSDFSPCRCRWRTAPVSSHSTLFTSRGVSAGLCPDHAPTSFLLRGLCWLVWQAQGNLPSWPWDPLCLHPEASPSPTRAHLSL